MERNLITLSSLTFFSYKFFLIVERTVFIFQLLFDWLKLPHQLTEQIILARNNAQPLFALNFLFSYAGVAVIDRPKCLSQLGAKSKMANLYDVEADADRSEERPQFDRTPKS